MDIHHALTLFHLPGPIPIEQLNSSFRGLVKKYHPDKLLKYPLWAHERMTEINTAYEILAAWISSSPRAFPGNPNVDEGPEQELSPRGEKKESQKEQEKNFPPNQEGNRNTSKNLSKQQKEALHHAFQQFLDGLGLYYEYGLENHRYQQEGVRRFRLREALRIAVNGYKKLDILGKANRHPTISAAARFARLSIADMENKEFHWKEGSPFIKDLDRKFFTSRQQFDAAVKEIFYPETIPPHLRGNYLSGLYASYTVFILCITMLPPIEKKRRFSNIIMASRYDAFMTLLELRKKSSIHF